MKEASGHFWVRPGSEELEGLLKEPGTPGSGEEEEGVRRRIRQQEEAEEPEVEVWATEAVASASY